MELKPTKVVVETPGADKTLDASAKQRQIEYFINSTEILKFDCDEC